ncbi:integrase arm-type DNA-binding domain-containing protein [Serratia fonticola]|uniref:integrase arm-type DNA-binding domain-containing protein n=1 Tax=Serratia fonticola TaxID=47917 RepID=UPI003D81BA97
MRLTSREVTNSKPRTKPYGLADGGGLFLWINPNGLKYWHFRYSHNLKQHRISLGTYPAMSLQLARERAAEAHALLARNIDPGQKRKQDKLKIIENQTNTFRITDEEWYQGKIKAGLTCP